MTSNHPQQVVKIFHRVQFKRNRHLGIRTSPTQNAEPRKSLGFGKSISPTQGARWCTYTRSQSWRGTYAKGKFRSLYKLCTTGIIGHELKEGLDERDSGI